MGLPTGRSKLSTCPGRECCRFKAGSKNSPQYRHFTATARIDSPQMGHTFVGSLMR
jgi:hypothetical protein